MEQNNSADTATQKHLEFGEKKIILVGTAHVSSESIEEVKKVGFAVDACLSTFEALQDCQIICVHHGMMWPSWDKVQGVNRKRLKFLLDHNINLFVSHLPLDRHPQLGNNAQILSKLGWEKTGEFGEVGWLCDLEKPISLEETKQKLAQKIK